MLSLDLDRLCRYIAGNVYDVGHGLLPEREWVLDATPLMKCIAEASGLAPEELGKVFDLARFRVAWERLAQEGSCASWGGMECQRVLAEWLRTDRVKIASFIRERANVGPDGA